MSGIFIDDPVSLTQALVDTNLIDGDELVLSGPFSGDYEVTRAGTVLRAGTNPIIDGSLHINANDVVVAGLHIYDADLLVRSSADYNGLGGIRVDSERVTLQDMIIHDCKGGGIYLSETTLDTVIDGAIVFHNGWLWTEDNLPHGHGAYFHCGKVTLKNSIFINNANNNTQVYGTVNHDDVIYENNISIIAHEMFPGVADRGMNFQASVEARAIIRGNCSYSRLSNARMNAISQMGDGTLENNYLVEGIYNFDPDLWATNSGNVLARETTNYVRVISVRGRAHVAVYNWELLDSVTVDLSSAFSPGASVTVINALDYFVDRQTATVGQDGTISVDMRAASHTVAAPQGLSAPATTFPEFGCFVVVEA